MAPFLLGKKIRNRDMQCSLNEHKMHLSIYVIEVGDKQIH